MVCFNSLILPSEIAIIQSYWVSDPNPNDPDFRFDPPRIPHEFYREGVEHDMIMTVKVMMMILDRSVAFRFVISGGVGSKN